VDEALVELASYGAPDGLDWDSLNAAGKGLLDSDLYLEHMDAVWERWARVMATLNITDAELEETSPEQARAAWKETTESITDKARHVLAALADGELTVAWDSAVTIYGGAVRSLVIALAVVTHEALQAHEAGVVRYAVDSGQLTLAQAQGDADNVVKLWKAVIELDREGALNELKRPEYLNGLGAAWLTAPVAVVLISIIAIIAFVVVVIWAVSEWNDERRRWCLDSNNDVKADAPAWCYEEPPQPLATFLEPLGRTGQAIGTAVGVALGVGALVWVGAWALPRLAQKRATG